MAIEFSVRSCSRKCTVTERTLTPGDPYFSVLIDDGNEIIRLDFGAESWKGPPEEHLGWWRARIAGGKSNKPQLAPSEVLINLLERWADEPDQIETRYVLTLLMIRRRMLREESANFAAGFEGDRPSADKPILKVYCQQNDKNYEVPIAKPSAERVSDIQQYLSGLLFADAA